MDRFRSAFVAGGAAGYGEPGAGDHLQSLYRFWLVGQQLERGAAPWRDPYSFQPLVEQQINLSGWPFGLPFWPLEAAFGPVVAWNVLQLAVIAVAGLATYGWLRALDVPTGAAVAGGLAFALAPYRVAQSAGHLLGWVAVLVPVALWAFERSRAASTPRRAHAWGALAFVALVSVPLSGQVHLSIGALPLCLAYALVRRDRVATSWMAAAALGGIGAGLAIRLTVIAESNASGGRSLDQVAMFSAHVEDLLSRRRRDGIEEFVYLGWLTPLLALAGLAALVRSRRRLLAAVLGLALVVPVLFALGTHTPIYPPIWRHFPPLHFTRVPGRLLPLADLALAALAAFALAWLLRRLPARRVVLGSAVAALLVVGDLLVLPLHSTAADPGNAAYAAIARSGPGRIVELPLFEPGIHYGSIYHYYELQAPRERPSGYSTLAPPAAYAFFWDLNRLNCGILLGGDIGRLRALGIRRLTFHAGAFAQSGRANPWFAWRALEQAGLRSVVRGGRVWLFPLDRFPGTPVQPPPVPEPDRTRPVFCEGWRGFSMKERDAPLWLYTGSRVELTLTAPGRTKALVRVDGTRLRELDVDRRVVVRIPFTTTGWHSIVLAVPQLFLDVRPVRGLTLAKLRYEPAA
jgi:hypothetical protein